MTDKQRELLEIVNSDKYLVENKFKFSFDEEIFIIRRNSKKNENDSILCKLIDITETKSYQAEKAELTQILIFEEVVDKTNFLLNDYNRSAKRYSFVFNTLIDDIKEFKQGCNKDKYTYNFRWIPVLLYLNIIQNYYDFSKYNFEYNEDHKPTQEELEDIFREDEVPKNFPKKINNNFKPRKDFLFDSNKKFLNKCKTQYTSYNEFDINRKKKTYDSKLAKQFNDLCRNADHLSPKLLELFNLDRDNLGIVFPFNTYKFRIYYNVGNLHFNYALFNLVKVEKGEQKIYFENEEFNQKFVITLNDLINLPKNNLNIIYVYNTSKTTKEKENI